MKQSKISSFIRSAIVLSSMAGLALAQAQAQPTLSNIYPDGSVQFQYSNSLSFVAGAPAGFGSIQVTLTGTKLDGSGSILRVLGIGSGLNVTTSGSNKTCSAPITSNMVYTVSIAVTDTTGGSTNYSYKFDTIRPAFTFEAEDYDYNSGQFIDNPQPGAYKGLVAVDGVDAHNASGGDQAYRPHDAAGGGLATEGCGDTPRAQWKSAGLTDYDVGWNNNGNWANYTRHFPNGEYNVYMRASNPNGLSSGAATMTDGAVGLNGAFNVPNTGSYQTYTWVPLIDPITGAPAIFFGDGSVSTVTVTTGNGSYNVNCYMFVPLDFNAGGGSADASIDSLYPDGSYQFQPTNSFNMAISSSSGINASDITIMVNETNLMTGIGTSKAMTSSSGLTVTGSATSRTVSTPIHSNSVYTLQIQIFDQVGNSLSSNLVFDTISPAFSWEAEDWDYGAGKYYNSGIDQYTITANPDTFVESVTNVDYARMGTGGGLPYRVGVPQENASDIPRLDHVSLSDYDLGNVTSGDWENYTRDFPAGKYNIFIRTANGNSGMTTTAGKLALVTSGVGTTDQTLQSIGTYDSPGTGGWQKYTWRPIKDAGGNLAIFTGGTKTIRQTMVNGNANQGFYVLIPADPGVSNAPFADSFVPDGSAMFAPTNVFSFQVHSQAGIPTSGVTVNIDGVNSSQATFNGSANLWTVNCPVSTNAFHTVTVTLKDAYGSATNTMSFATFDSATTYIFEAEDFDHDSGQFFDFGSPVNSYNGLGAVANVDTYTVPGNWDGTHAPYRTGGLNQENAGDSQELPAHSGIQNYDLGNTAAGNWGNYTRNWPAGVYNIYMRAANGTGGSSPGGSMDVVISGVGTTSQATTNLGTFANVPSTGGWQSYTWVPLKDNSGNLAQFTGGSQRTLRAICGGGQNEDYYAIVPMDPSLPVLSGLYPDGSIMFQSTNKLGFVATSTAGIDINSITVTLNGVVVPLTCVGSATSWTVSTPLAANTSYAVTIAVQARNGGVFTTSYNFDTYSSSYYTWEAEDFNYGGGKYFEGSMDAYAGLGFVSGIDGDQADPGVNGFAYRATNTDGTPITGTATAGDVQRSLFTGTNIDYRITWFGPGSWLNYTRHFPSGTYYVYGRFTEGASPAQVTLSQVTSGATTTSQQKTFLGTFFVPLAGWNTWAYTPLTDARTNLVTVTFTGNETTLQLGGSPVSTDATINANYFMLIPASSGGQPTTLTASVSGGKVDITFATKTGSSYQVYYKNNLTDSTWTALGTSVSGNGSIQTVSDTLSQTHRFYRLQIQ